MKRFVKAYKQSPDKIDEKMIIRVQIALSVGIKRIKDLEEELEQKNNKIAGLEKFVGDYKANTDNEMKSMRDISNNLQKSMKVRGQTEDSSNVPDPKRQQPSKPGE